MKCPIEAKEIPFLNGRYFATKDGLIWDSMKSMFLKQSHNQGYSVVKVIIPDFEKDFRICSYKTSSAKRIHKKNTSFIIGVHRLIALTYISDNPCKNLIVDHINRNRSDNRVENLRWVTFKENVNNSTKVKWHPRSHDKKILGYDVTFLEFMKMTGFDSVRIREHLTYSYKDGCWDFKYKPESNYHKAWFEYYLRRAQI